MKTKYTLSIDGYQAFSVKGEHEVIIPDEVRDDQKGFDGREFPILKRPKAMSYNKRVWEKGRGRLRGDLYGLHTPGTGDPVVTITA